MVCCKKKRGKCGKNNVWKNISNCPLKKEENAEKTMCGKIFQIAPLKRCNN